MPFTVALIPNPWHKPFGLRLGESGIPGLDHDPLDDLTDPDPAERPDRRVGWLPRFLGLADAVCGVEGA
ncbi:hypothetical protein [Sulfitobacter sp. M39]|uniref:hypothetical protein n=1 Tax=Sulfitobacter sp. M39 TaxID=2675334 RepID=UPI001F39F2D8|nr:hypothetical protein [Sulfitobacter sp. M39]